MCLVGQMKEKEIIIQQLYDTYIYFTNDNNILHCHQWIKWPPQMLLVPELVASFERTYKTHSSDSSHGDNSRATDLWRTFCVKCCVQHLNAISFNSPLGLTWSLDHRTTAKGSEVLQTGSSQHATKDGIFTPFKSKWNCVNLFQLICPYDGVQDKALSLHLILLIYSSVFTAFWKFPDDLLITVKNKLQWKTLWIYLNWWPALFIMVIKLYIRFYIPVLTSPQLVMFGHTLTSFILRVVPGHFPDIILRPREPVSFVIESHRSCSTWLGTICFPDFCVSFESSKLVKLSSARMYLFGFGRWQFITLTQGVIVIVWFFTMDFFIRMGSFRLWIPY